MSGTEDIAVAPTALAGRFTGTRPDVLDCTPGTGGSVSLAATRRSHPAGRRPAASSGRRLKCAQSRQARVDVLMQFRRAGVVEQLAVKVGLSSASDGAVTEFVIKRQAHDPANGGDAVGADGLSGCLGLLRRSRRQ